jgi:protein tyrosine/serine phosphatase
VQHDRILSTRQIHNLRDYGCYGVRGGGHLRRGRLFRSGQHSEASEADLAVVGGLDLAAIVDLRSADERAARPTRSSPGSRAIIVTSTAYRHARAPHDAAMEETETAEAMRQKHVDYYIDSPFKNGQIDCLRLYFDTLLTVDGASLVHCAAGKDRTGIAVALFHSVMGVAQEEILADYLLTNQAGDINDRAASYAYSIQQHLGEGLSDDLLRIGLSVEADYLAAMFRTLDERCNGVEGYVSAILGLSSSDLDRLRAKYIE